MPSAAEKSLHAQLASHESWAQTENRSARTSNGRAAFDQKFLDEAGGDPVRAEHLRKAHYARMALKSAQARRKIKEQTQIAEAAEAELAELGGNDHAA